MLTGRRMANCSMKIISANEVPAALACGDVILKKNWNDCE
jgi:hypothetical protein